MAHHGYHPFFRKEDNCPATGYFCSTRGNPDLFPSCLFLLGICVVSKLRFWIYPMRTCLEPFCLGCLAQQRNNLIASQTSLSMFHGPDLDSGTELDRAVASGREKNSCLISSLTKVRATRNPR